MLAPSSSSSGADMPAILPARRCPHCIVARLA